MEADRAVLRCAEEVVAGLGAEMRQVYGGHRVGGADAEHAAGSHGNEALSCAEHRQGAEKPLAVDLVIPVHICAAIAILPRYAGGAALSTAM